MATVPGEGAPRKVATAGSGSAIDSGPDSFYEADAFKNDPFSPASLANRSFSRISQQAADAADAALAAEAEEAASDLVVEDLQGLRPRAKSSPDGVPWNESWGEEGPPGGDRCGGMNSAPPFLSRLGSCWNTGTMFYLHNTSNGLKCRRFKSFTAHV